MASVQPDQALPTSETMAHDHGPLTLHPDFDQGDTILQSVDGVGFCYDLAVLGRYSRVFKDLSTLPRSQRDSCKITMLDACSKAIAFVLHVIQHSQEEWDESCTTDKASLNDLEEVLEEVLEMIDTFHMESLPEMILEWAKQSETKETGVMYCLSCLSGVGDRQYWATRCLNRPDLEEQVGPAFDLLRRYSPEDALALGRLTIRWNATVENFEQLFMADTSFSRFDDECKGAQLCETYQTFDGSNEQLKWHVLRELVPVVQGAPQDPEEARLDLVLVCNNNLSCRKCARRMINIAQLVWKRTMVPPPWILHPTHPSLVSEVTARRRQM